MIRTMARLLPAGYEDDNELANFDYEDFERNLKITIVPDITAGAGINGTNFDNRLSPEMQTWFNDFREMWKSFKKSIQTQQKLKVTLLNNEQPLLLALKLFATCPDCNNLKNKNLALFILETTCDLYKDVPTIAATCDDNTRMVAFNFIKNCGISSLYIAVKETFELHKIRDLLVPKIQELVSQGEFKNAAHWAIYLDLTQLFGVFEIIFPLILQDKTYLVDEYLNAATEHQLPTVQFLDSLLNKPKTVFQLSEEIISKYQYPDIKHSVLSYRPMSKLVVRLAKKYNISSEHTPNLTFTKACSYMHYLYKKYEDGTMSCDAFRELIHDTANTKQLQLNVVKGIESYGDLDEATFWAAEFQIPLHECPENVQLKLQGLWHDDSNNGSANSMWSAVNVNAPEVVETTNPITKSLTLPNSQKAKTGNTVNADEFLTLTLPDNCIVLVNDKQKFLDMLNYLEIHTLIAFDSEWKPSHCNDSDVALLQLAVTDSIYLIDCQSRNIDENLWRQLGRRIFNNLEILKIGFSLMQDLRMLQKSLPLQLNIHSSACYLDLRELYRRLKYMQIVVFPYGNSNHTGESLCNLCELCLGKKLDKSNQFSNWANRPLRYDQTIYAALDAHCLLKIFQVIAELLERLGLDVDQVIEEITTSKTGYLFRMKRVISGQKGPEWNCANGEDDRGTISATEVKLVCDMPAFNIAKELRKLGLDCMETNKWEVRSCIKLAKEDNRYVITSAERSTHFNKELPLTQIIQLKKATTEKQVIQILTYLCIQVEQRNLFTRCLECNGNEFILAQQKEMQILCLNKELQGSKVDGRCGTISPYDRTFELLNVNEHIMSTKTTYRGKSIKVQRLKPQTLLTKDFFFICDNCGVCTWDGMHSLPSSIMDFINSFVPGKKK